MTSSPSDGVVLALAGASKRYGDAWVVEDADLELRGGEIHALCGENGAGKSTMVNMLGGIVRPDRGSVLLDGAPLDLADAAQARALGIAVIHQHPVLFPDLSVAENIFLASQATRSVALANHRAATKQAREMLARLDVRLDVTVPAGALAIADQQMVEIAKSLGTEPRVLILDEPTASLTPYEVGRLSTVLRDLRSRGVAVLMVNHRLGEVFDTCHRITVLRSGRQVSSRLTKETSRAEIIREMVGRNIAPRDIDVEHPPGEVLLETRGLTRAGVFSDVNLSVRAGEVVGMAGLIGAGRTEIAQAIFGIQQADSGEIFVRGEKTLIRSSADAVAAGLALVPEDRREHGLAVTGSVEQNMVITSLPDIGRRGVVRRALEHSFAARMVRQLAVVCRGLDQPVEELSGGNQQKVVLAKWLSTNPTVLLLDEPTFGVDIGAQEEIHKIIRGLAQEGTAVLLISSDMIELLVLSDRILVVHEGNVCAEFEAGSATEAGIMLAAVGGVGA